MIGIFDKDGIIAKVFYANFYTYLSFWRSKTMIINELISNN